MTLSSFTDVHTSLRSVWWQQHRDMQFSAAQLRVVSPCVSVTFVRSHHVFAKVPTVAAIEVSRNTQTHTHTHTHNLHRFAFAVETRPLLLLLAQKAIGGGC